MPSSKAPIDTWSFSTLENFETCPYRLYLEKVLRIPKPEVAPLPDGREHPLTRGKRVHDSAEHFIKRDIELIPELAANFASDFLSARARYLDAPDLCVVEDNWAVTIDWRTTGWTAPDTWGRMKLDLGLLSDDRTHIDIVDYKTGKKYPPKHVQQGQLYAIAAFARYPELKTATASFWYVDIEDPTRADNYMSHSYSKLKTTILRESFDARAKALTSATEFPPRTSAYACRFCPYGEGRDGNSYCEFRFSSVQ